MISSRPFRISHRSLESIRLDAKTWVEAQNQGSEIRRASYASLTREAIYNLHASDDLHAATKYLQRRLAGAHLKNLQRYQEAELELAAYSNWRDQAGPGIGLSWRFRCKYPLAKGVVLVGEISRVDADLARDEYHAILLGPEPEDWPVGLRFPLLQRVVATAFSRDEATVRIGIQNIDGSGLTISPPCSASQIDAAERKARHLAKRVLRFVAAGAP